MKRKLLSIIILSLFIGATFFSYKAIAAEPGSFVYNKRFILLDRYTGYGGESIYVRGYGFDPFEEVQIYFDDAKDDPGTYINANEYGNFNSTLKTIPDWESDKYKVYADGEESGGRASADFYIRGYSPWARPHKYYMHVGEYIGYRGFGFKPNSDINLYYRKQLIATFASDADGNFDVPNVLEVPEDWRDDDIKQYFIEPTTGEKIEFKLTIAK